MPDRSPPADATRESRGHHNLGAVKTDPGVPDWAGHTAPQGTSPQTHLYDDRECRDCHRLDRDLLAALTRAVDLHRIRRSRLIGLWNRASGREETGLWVRAGLPKQSSLREFSRRTRGRRLAGNPG